MGNTHLDFDLVRLPDADIWQVALQGKGSAGVLILTTDDLVEADQTFLDNILKAAKLDPPADTTFQLVWSKGDRIPLVHFCGQQKIQIVLNFGCNLAAVGIRATVPYYQFVRLGDLQLLCAHPLPTIRQEREQKNNQKAGLLWQALKAKFV